VKTARTNVAALTNALEQYSLDMYDYPTTQQGLEALVTEPADANNAGSYRRGGYIQKLPLDPWGRPFVYERPAQRSDKAYDLYSLGADGQEGGEDENADIGNWN
ncbi:MAG: type II secretion system major pseudopilin GspG, partial [Henriciella sp.]